jgi:hypothetical protein
MRCRCADNPWPGMLVLERHDDGSIVYGPCPDCGGSCIISCCDGAVGGAADVTNAPTRKDAPYG